MTSAVNTGQILEALNDKLDRDTLNINDTGEINMASMGMPSNMYEDLTLGASGTEYTAPANGWFAYKGIFNTSSNSTAQFTNTVNGIVTKLIGDGSTPAGCGMIIPVKEGDIITFDYYNITHIWLRFIYAQGSESEVS